jgi:hypothetical protein
VTDETRQNANDLGAYFRAERDARNSTQPLLRPEILDATPPTNAAQLAEFNLKFADAETSYFQRLMQRGKLSAAEIKTLGAAVARYLKSAK